MADRKAELERRKAKLEQLGAEKKHAEEEKKGSSSGSLAAAAGPRPPVGKDLRLETDDILELGIPTGDVPRQQ